MTRLLVAAIVLTHMVVWAVLSIKTGTFLPVPGENVGLVGLALGAKVWQKGKEDGG